MVAVNAATLHDRFAAGLLAAVADGGGGGDVVVSPWSVSSALAVLAPGVDDLARAQIDTALGGDAGAAGAVAALAADAAAVARWPTVPGDDSVLAVANTLWVDDGCRPAPAFAADLERWPGAAVRPAALRTAPEAARAAINADVADLTRGLVPEILPAGALTSDDRAVTVNALYLLAAWVEPFLAADTSDETFHAPSGAWAVPTMRGWREAAYTDDGWQYLALPLQRGLHAEVLLAPPGEPSAGLPAPDVLAGLRTGATTHRVDLHLPRFRAETTVGLIGPLRALGVDAIFDQIPRLVGVVDGPHLRVAGAFHGAVLRVDERGVEGAAATAIVARRVAYVRLREAEMRVDRPFVLLVTDRATGAILFAARVTEPATPP
jgi:serpin B